jgi:hypothetical protein
MLDTTSDKDVQEDTDSNDDFERKFEDSIQAYKDFSSRPSSSSSRPKTASRHRDDSESRTNLIAASIIQVYLRLSNFISASHLSKSDLVSCFGDYSTLDRFRKGFADLGFDLTDAELHFIFRDCGARTGLLRLAEFYKKIIAEVQEDEEETPRKNPDVEALRKEAERMLMPASPKRARRRKKSSEVGKTREMEQRRPPSAPQYRKEACRSCMRERQVKKHREVVDEGKRRELEMDCIRKMGEANEIMRRLGMEKSFRSCRKKDRRRTFHVYEKEVRGREISMDGILREWKKLRNEKIKVMKVTISQVASRSAIMSAISKKNERQAELKKILQETQELTNSLLQKIQGLDSKHSERRKFQQLSSLT